MHDPNDHSDEVSRTAPLIRPGWSVDSWAGDRIGTVVEIAADALSVRLNSIDAKEVRVPMALVSTEDEARQLAILSVDASELDGVEPRTGQPDLTGGPT